MIGVPVEAYTALWIEIRPWQASVVGLRSRLIQPCGLKYRQHKCFTCIDRSRLIQPCGLKCHNKIWCISPAKSRLIQPCGLKYRISQRGLYIRMSRLIQPCGLKLFSISGGMGHLGRGLYSLMD